MLTIASEHAPADGLAQGMDIPLPPEQLRHRVHGAADAESFLAIDAKNQHILHLERNMTQVESGCMLRLLRWAGRR